MKNILLIAMPSVPILSYGQLTPQDYVCDGGICLNYPEVQKCIFQHEPLTRLVVQNFEGETQVIILCPKEAEEKVELETAIEPKEILSPISTVGYYLLRLARSNVVDLDGLVVEQEDDAIAKFTLGAKKKISFVFVRGFSGHNDCSSDILAATDVIVKEIRSQREKQDVRLFASADCQRDALLVLSSVLSMLKTDQLEPVGIFSIDHWEGKIVDVSRSFDMAGYVEAINAFDKYGDAKAIASYYGKYMGSQVREDPLFKALAKLSEGMTFCNVNLYQEGLQDVKDLLDGTIDSQITQRDEFAIFRNDLENDYGRLLSSEQIRFVDIIRRCLMKDRLQQALSFIEARFTNDLYSCGVVYFDPDEAVTVKKIEREVEGTAIDYIKYAIFRSRRSYVKDPVLFVLQDYCNVHRYRKPGELKDRVNDLYDKRNLMRQVLSMVPDAAYNVNDVTDKIREIGVFGRNELLRKDRDCKAQTFYKFKEGNLAFDTGFFIHTALGKEDLDRKYRVLASQVLCLYYVLKDTRNTFNHGEGMEQPDHEKVMELAILFCDCADVLLDYAKTCAYQPRYTAEEVQTRYLLLSK